MSIRKAIIKEIELLSSPSMQLQYEIDVPIANVPAELVCGFCDDLFHPESEQIKSQFTGQEINELSLLYKALSDTTNIEVSTVKELLKHKKWLAVIEKAKILRDYYE